MTEMRQVHRFSLVCHSLVCHCLLKMDQAGCNIGTDSNAKTHRSGLTGRNIETSSNAKLVLQVGGLISNFDFLILMRPRLRIFFSSTNASLVCNPQSKDLFTI